VNDAQRISELVRNQDLVRALHDLERKGHVHGARDTGHVALGFRIAGCVQVLRVRLQAVLEVLLLLLARPRLIRDLVALDDARAAGRRTVYAEQTRERRRTGLVRQDVSVGGIHRLPDTIQIGRLGADKTRCAIP
jgi:hypothetical protein